MSTKILMVSSAIVFAIFGLAATFFPIEILKYMNAGNALLSVLLIQIIGSLYLGFAFMNWMARATIIGGIYSKPLSIGNFSHLFIASVSLIKTLPVYTESKILWIITLVYSVLTLFFARVSFGKLLKR